MKFLLALSLLLCYIVDSQSDSIAGHTFHVKPDGTLNLFEKDLDNTYKCSFKYKATGGTHEEWHLTMEVKNDGKNLECSVTRGKSSYLYFETFSIAVTGSGVSIKDFSVSDNDRELDRAVCQLDKKNNAVSSVTGQFKNSLKSVSLHAVIDTAVPKKEL